MLSEPGLGVEPGEGGHAFEDAPAIGETPCRLKPRDDGTRAPGGRWVCGGFLRLAVCYRSGSPLRWTAARLKVRECSACLARERDGWTFKANPMRHCFAATVLAVQSSAERVGQLLHPDQLISRRFEACLALFG